MSFFLYEDMNTKCDCNLTSVHLNGDMETLVKEYVVSVCQPSLVTIYICYEYIFTD